MLDKLKAIDFDATILSTYDFSTLYTTLPHNLIKDKLIDLIERSFNNEGSTYFAFNDRNAFFLLPNISIRFGTKLYRQEVGIICELIVLPWLPIYNCLVMRETL